jgi:hypothetical protein
MENNKPKVKLVGENGNIYNLVGLAALALQKAGQRDKAEEMKQRLFKCLSYNEALMMIQDYVEPY